VSGAVEPGPGVGPNGRRIVVVGDVVTDIVATPKAPIAHGTDTAAEITMVAGGSGANTAAWIGFLGGNCEFVGRVGSDQAAWHNSMLRSAGVQTFLTVDPVRPTARIVVLVDSTGERTMLTDRGANDALSADDVGGVDVSATTVIHVSGYTLLFDGPRAAGISALDRGRACGAILSVDPNSAGFLTLTGPDAFLAMTTGVDVCFPNADELRVLTRRTEPEAAACALSSHYGTVVAKLGAAGAFVAQNGEVVVRSAALPARVIDTIGAGDAFAAGYLVALAGGQPVTACLAGALSAASQAVSLLGARPFVERPK
jgi:sugar/nucleoside kinase (ribokinase family)